MFSPSSLDEVVVQETYIEAGKSRVCVSLESSSKKEGKCKEKSKRTNSIKMEDEKLSCKNCKNEGHDEENCLQLHPHKQPKWSKGKKGKQKVVVAIMPTDLGLESGDEAQNVVGLASKFDNGIYFNNYYDKKRLKLFHIRVIMKKTKIDTLIDSGSQVNLISEEMVKQLGLKIKMHHKPYTLNWMSKSHKL